MLKELNTRFESNCNRCSVISLMKYCFDLNLNIQRFLLRAYGT
jgi:hypothetical protein